MLKVNFDIYAPDNGFPIKTDTAFTKETYRSLCNFIGVNTLNLLPHIIGDNVFRKYENSNQACRYILYEIKQYPDRHISGVNWIPPNRIVVSLTIGHPIISGLCSDT